MRVVPALLLLFAALWPNVATAQAPDFVTLTYTADRANVLVTLNGFPVLEDSARYSLTGGQPVNWHLVPTGNRLEIQFEPLVPPDSVEFADLRIDVHSGNQGDVVGTDYEGDLVSVSLEGKDGPQTLVETFDLPEAWRDGFTAGRLYAEVPVITDEEEVSGYALRLFGMAEAGEYEAFAREAELRIQSYRDAHPAAGLPGDDAALQDLFRQIMEEMLSGMSLNTDVHKGTLAPRPWAGGRLWELRLVDGRPLISATDGEGGVSFLSVYVARVDGALRIVR